MGRSPAVTFIHLAAVHNGEVFGGRSNERWDSAVSRAAMFACEYGFRFAPDDLVNLAKTSPNYKLANMESHRDGMQWKPHEGFYGMACGHRWAGSRCYGVNRAAAIAYERLVERKPWIYRDQHNLSGGRLYVGARIQLVGADKKWVVAREDGSSEVLDVTSFNDEKDTLVACSYHEQKDDGHHENKVNRRFTLTREILKVHNDTIAEHCKAKKRAADAPSD